MARTSFHNSTPEVQTVTWSNGNPTSISDNSGTTTYEYYPDKPSQQGNYLNILKFDQQYYYKIWRPKNLIKSITDGSDISNINYSFDSDGKIGSLTIIDGSSTNTVNYQYQCN